MFCHDLIDSQKNSTLMSLPPKIRLMIWNYVLSPPYNNSAKTLSILASCRLAHGEAVVRALESTTFHVGRAAGLEFQSKLWSLGTLTQHLRHIRVEICLKDSTARSANNPFFSQNFLSIISILIWESSIPSTGPTRTSSIITSCPRSCMRSQSTVSSLCVFCSSRRQKSIFTKCHLACRPRR
jgi:hypothetical protein